MKETLNLNTGDVSFGEPIRMVLLLFMGLSKYERIWRFRLITKTRSVYKYMNIKPFSIINDAYSSEETEIVSNEDVLDMHNILQNEIRKP